MEHRQRLIIRVSRGSLAFSTADGLKAGYERYALNSSISLAANMREALRNTVALQQDFERVTVLVDAPVMLIPTDLYREEEEEELYRYTHSVQEQSVIVHHILPDLNAVAVFCLPKDLRTVLTDRFGSVHYVPLMAAVCRHMFKRSFTGPRNKLYAYFHDRRMEVFCFAQNRFKFYNSFAVSGNPNDSLYYLLSVWKQLGMNPREDELHMAGIIPEQDQLKEQAQLYVKRVFWVIPSGEFNRAPVTQIEGMPYDVMLCYLNKN